MQKHVYIADIKTPAGRYVPVIATVKWHDGELSITAVEGPKSNGNCHGSFGQVRGKEYHENRAPYYDKFISIWDRWHLNKLRAGSPAQEQFLRDNLVKAVYPESYYDLACKVLRENGLNPDQGYHYGSAWLKEEVPQDVIDWLFSLPDYNSLPSLWAA